MKEEGEENDSVQTQMQTQAIAQPYYCTVCGFGCNTINRLKKHRLSHADRVKQIQCPRCVRRFNRRPDLKRHLHRFHKDETIDVALLPVQVVKKAQLDTKKASTPPPAVTPATVKLGVPATTQTQERQLGKKDVGIQATRPQAGPHPITTITAAIWDFDPIKAIPVKGERDKYKCWLLRQRALMKEALRHIEEQEREEKRQAKNRRETRKLIDKLRKLESEMWKKDRELVEVMKDPFADITNFD